MASPFKAFRKRQKTMIAILAILAMFAFVVLPIVGKRVGSHQVRNAPVVTTTKYGNIEQSTLREMQIRRRVMLRLLDEIARAVAQAGGDARNVQMVRRAFEPDTTEAVVDTWLLANRAEELGIVISRDRINQFLAGITTSQGLTAEQVRKILAALELSQMQLFAMLEHELLALELQEFFQLSVGGVPPAQRWDYYQRLNRKVTIEALAVPVSQFTAEIPDPGDDALKELFELHKDKPSNPASADPGFIEPMRISVDYVKADYGQLFEAEMAVVPRDKIEAFYQEHIEEFKKEALPEVPISLGPQFGPAVDPEAPADPKAQSDSPESVGPEMPAGPQEPADAETKKDSSPRNGASEDVAPTEDPEEVETPEKPKSPAPKKKPAKEPVEGDSPKAGDAEVNEAKAGDAKPKAKSTDRPDTDAPKTDDGASSVTAASPFRFASFAEEDEAAEKTPEKVADRKVDAPANPPAAAEEAPEEPMQEPVESKAAEAPAVASKEPSGETVEASKEPAPVEYRPLESVEDEIRRTLARQSLDAKIDTAFHRIEDQIRRYGDELMIHDPEDGGSPPAEPDLSDIYRLVTVEERPESGMLTRGKTELLSALEAAKLDVGKSRVNERAGFVEFAFGTDCPLYRTSMSEDLDGNRYIFWKLDESEERVPEFDDPGVRDRVLEAWRTIEAREPARAEAERLAAEASEAGLPLAEVFAGEPGREVVATEPFSWMTYGAIPAWWARMPPRISQIKPSMSGNAETAEADEDAIEMPGNDFMREVCGLGKGEVGVAFNHPEKIAYVVRVTDVNPMPEVMQKLFLSADYNGYALVGTYDRYDAMQAWVDQIKSEAGFEWDEEAKASAGGR